MASCLAPPTAAAGDLQNSSPFGTGTFCTVGIWGRYKGSCRLGPSGLRRHRGLHRGGGKKARVCCCRAAVAERVVIKG